MAGDWIKLHRSMLDAEQMTDDWLCRLWVWCLLRANFVPAMFRGQIVQPGQFVTGRISAASELKVSPSKWYRGIQRLQEMGCLTYDANSNWTTLTICKWQTYQESEDNREQPEDSERTADDTTSGQPADTIKEGKKVRRKEGKKIPPNPQGGTGDGDKRIQLPENLQTPAFQQAWIDWIEYRKQLGKKLTRIGAQKLMNRLSKMGTDRAIAAIEFSISTGYQGLVEERDTNGQVGFGKGARRGPQAIGPGQRYDAEAAAGRGVDDF